MKAQELIAGLDKAIEKAIDVPNSLLPVELHSKRGYRSLAAIKRIAKIKEEKTSEHKLLKTEKAARIAAYRANLESGVEIEYMVNEELLYKKQLAFAGAAIKSGALDADDFEE